MPSGAPTPSITGWTRSVESAVRCVIVVPMGLVFLTSLRPMAAEFGRLDTGGGIGLIVLGAVQLAVCVLVLTRRNTLISDLGLVIVTTAALGLILLGQPPGRWEANWWPTSAVHIVQIYILGFGGSYRWVGPRRRGDGRVRWLAFGRHHRVG